MLTLNKLLFVQVICIANIVLQQATQPDNYSFISTVAVVIGILIQGLLIIIHNSKQHGENQTKITAILAWQKQHEIDSGKRDKAISHLTAISASMQATANAMEKAVELMQQDMREIRKDVHRPHKS